MIGTLVGCLIGAILASAFIQWRSKEYSQWFFTAGIAWSLLCVQVVEYLK